ncbi:MAG TPA: malto-oligosyltrehalose synthase, partial [Planctomycetota bacterium]|nr:malto-oligosyltrehalose synthase [Planctomycetota bacterium]
GEYIPLEARGPRARHIVAFARRAGGEAAIAVAARFFLSLRLEAPGRDDLVHPVGGEVWGDTALALGPLGAGRWRDALTGREVAARDDGGGATVALAHAFADLPLALLERLP